MNIHALVFFDSNTMKHLDIKLYEGNVGWIQKIYVHEFINFGAKELLKHFDLSNKGFIINLKSPFYVYFDVLDDTNCGCALIFSNNHNPIYMTNSCKMKIQQMTRLYNRQGIIPSESEVETFFKIQNVQNQIEDTHKTLQRTISKVLKRGETIDELVEKTEHLSNSSKIFFNKSKDLNSCCWGFIRKGF